MLQPLSFIADTSLYVVMCVKINESLRPPPLLPLSLCVHPPVRQAMLMAQQLNNKPLEAQACFSLANTYSLAGDHIMAAKYLNKHLYFAEELGDV